MRREFDLSVYLVADPSLCGGRAIIDVVRAALRGGITLLQYRDKVNAPNVLAENARALQVLAREFSVPFLMNDHVDIAAHIGADGVHIGQGDFSAAEARVRLGADAIIGVTAFTEAHIEAIDPAVVDYIGTGPFYETKTDKGKPVLGAARFAELAAMSPVPVVGIGGIEAETAVPVIEAGANGVAMMRAVSEAADVEAAASKFVEAVGVVK